VICLLPTRLRSAIAIAVTNRWIACDNPRFCVRLADVDQYTHGGLQPVLIHHSIASAEGAAFIGWAREFIKHTSLILVVPNNTAPLDYYPMQSALPTMVVLREVDLETSTRWQQLSATLVQLGPVRRALQDLQASMLATLTDHTNAKLLLSFTEHAVKRDQIAAMELQDLGASRGTLSRRFKACGFNEPTVLLLVVRTTLLTALVAQGVPLASACSLLHTNETAMRRTIGRRCDHSLAEVVRYPVPAVFQWCASFFLSGQPVVDASGALALLETTATVSQIGRRTA